MAEHSQCNGWSDEQLRARLEEVKIQICWTQTTGAARKWWEVFESENSHRLALVLRVAEELQARKATISEFYLAYVYSNNDNIQGILNSLHRKRVEKEGEEGERIRNCGK